VTDVPTDDAPPPRRPWWRTPWWRGTRERKALLIVEVVLIGLIGGWLGLLAGGTLDAGVGPLRTHLSVQPSVRGGSVLSIPPLGELRVRTHAGPWRLNAEVTRIDAADARRIFSNPASVNGLGEKVAKDLTGAVITVAIKAAIATVLGGLLLGVLVFRRRWRLVFLSGAVSAAVVIAGGAVAALTWDPKAINQPEYDGLLASAPGVVGDARSIVANFGKYEDQLGRLVTNVSRLYDVTSTLPAYQPDPSTIRVLSVSDLHLNPAAWDVIRSVTKQFNIDVIVDSGDLTDHGSAPENAYVDEIATMGAPYVWVRGNHDSAVTEAAVAAQPNAVVLDSTTPVEVAGLRFLGIGDPRFTPDKDTRDVVAPSSVSQVGLRMAEAMAAQPADAKVDVAVVHDGAAADEMDGTVPLVLSGHYHRREQHLLPGGTLSFWQGSTGASGLRGLEHEKPTPVRASVLYFDRDTRALQAWDDITLGGLGLVSAKIERRIVGQQFPELAPFVTPSPEVSSSSGTPVSPLPSESVPSGSVPPSTSAPASAVPPSSAPVSTVPAASASP
jgi:predicted phosphodiesterase